MGIMIIDFSTHLVPKSMTKLGIYFPPVTALLDIDERLRVMKKYGIDMQIVTITASVFKGASGEREVELCRIANDELAKLHDKYHGKFVGLAAVPLSSPDEAVEEIERARHDLGMPGAELYSNAKGKGLDGKEFHKIYDRLVKLDMPMSLHPTDWESYSLLSDYGLKNRIGWPFDTAQAMARMVYGGVFDKFPNLKIVAHHLGLIVPALMGRLMHYHVPPAEEDEKKRSKEIEKKFKMFYGDTAVNCWNLVLEFGYKFFGAKHIVFGSDYPYGWNGGEGWLQGNLKIVRDLEAPAREKKLIWEENTRKLLKL